MAAVIHVLIFVLLLLIFASIVTYGKLSSMQRRILRYVFLGNVLLLSSLFLFQKLPEETKDRFFSSHKSSGSSHSSLKQTNPEGTDTTTHYAKEFKNASTLFEAVVRSVVVVILYDHNRQAIGFGSGFFIDPTGRLITNHHVVKGASYADIRTVEGSSFNVKHVVAMSEENDLAMLEIDTDHKNFSYLNVSSILPKPGDKVVVIGTPQGMAHTISDGIVSGLRDVDGDPRYVQVTAPISSGSSGGPLLNMKGEVIGVATMSHRYGQNLNFCVAGEKIKLLNPGTGIPLRSVADRSRPTLAEVNKREEARKAEEAQREEFERRKRMEQERLQRHENLTREYHEVFAASKRYYDNGDYQSAFHHLNQALSIARSLNDNLKMANCLEGMGYVQEHWGRRNVAYQYHAQAAALRAHRR